MSSPMKMVLDVLALQGDIEWARCGGRVEPLRPPFVAWRYKLPTETTEQRIVEAVRCYAGPVNWVVDKGERNWAIQLDAFRTFARRFHRDDEALQRFGEEFPSETRAALDDAAGLAAHLDRELARPPPPGLTIGGPTR
jgi:hypothetical protein